MKYALPSYSKFSMEFNYFNSCSQFTSMNLLPIFILGTIYLLSTHCWSLEMVCWEKLLKLAEWWLMKLSNSVKGCNCYFVGARAGESFVMRLKQGCKFHWDYYWHCLDPKRIKRLEETFVEKDWVAQYLVILLILMPFD